MKKRNPIARVVTHIKPKIIPDKKKEDNPDWLKELIQYQDWLKENDLYGE